MKTLGQKRHMDPVLERTPLHLTQKAIGLEILTLVLILVIWVFGRNGMRPLDVPSPSEASSSLGLVLIEVDDGPRTGRKDGLVVAVLHSVLDCVVGDHEFRGIRDGDGEGHSLTGGHRKLRNTLFDDEVLRAKFWNPLEEYVKRLYIGNGVSDIDEYQFHSTALFGSRFLVNHLEIHGSHSHSWPESGNEKPLADVCRSPCLAGLLGYRQESKQYRPCSDSFRPSKDSIPTWQVPCGVLCAFIAFFVMSRWGNRPSIELIAFLLILVAGFLILTGYVDTPQGDHEDSSHILPRSYSPQHDGGNVPQRTI